MSNVAKLVEKLHSLCILTLLILLRKEINGIDAALNVIAILDEVIEMIE
jgi:hypothetical protein